MKAKIVSAGEVAREVGLKAANAALEEWRTECMKCHRPVGQDDYVSVGEYAVIHKDCDE